MNTVILIPARYQSSRYPGKPLVPLKGAGGAAKPLIQRSVEAARRVAGITGVFVVTDDDRIAEACAPANVGVIMTSPECRNGTERCAEALASLHEPDLIINFQGDALLTPAGFVEALISRMEHDSDAMVAVLPTSLDINDSLEEILAALGRAERKLVGVVLDELTPAAQTRQRGRQYA